MDWTAWKRYVYVYIGRDLYVYANMHVLYDYYTCVYTYMYLYICIYMCAIRVHSDRGRLYGRGMYVRIFMYM
jgi:hypothetical protein